MECLLERRLCGYFDHSTTGVEDPNKKVDWQISHRVSMKSEPCASLMWVFRVHDFLVKEEREKIDKASPK